MAHESLILGKITLLAGQEVAQYVEQMFAHWPESQEDLRPQSGPKKCQAVEQVEHLLELALRQQVEALQQVALRRDFLRQALEPKVMQVALRQQEQLVF